VSCVVLFGILLGFSYLVTKMLSYWGAKVRILNKNFTEGVNSDFNFFKKVTRKLKDFNIFFNRQICGKKFLLL